MLKIISNSHAFQGKLMRLAYPTKFTFWIYAGLIVAFSIFSLLPHRGNHSITLAQDFQVYWDAAGGDIAKTYTYSPGWLYNDKVLMMFKPFRLFDWDLAVQLFEAVLIISFLFITDKLFKLKFGWIVALGAVKPFIWNLQTGNIYPFLVV